MESNHEIKNISNESRDHLDVVEDMATAGDLTAWRNSIKYLISQWKKLKDYEPEKREVVTTALDKFDKMHLIDKRKYAPKLSEKLFNIVDWKKILVKSLENEAIIRILETDVFKKAIEVLNKDKNVDPSHKYSHKEGDDNNPKFFYTDQNGNYVRYTNAPSGHPDQNPHFGDPQPHMSEPMLESNPEYFTPEGKKLTRCPECAPESVEWNPNYNPHDPANLWAGRWIDPEDGLPRYTYIDADIRNFPLTRIHQQNAIVDTRLEAFRETVNELFSSDKMKDQITAITLALLDQGKFRAIELAMLTPADVVIQGNLITLGNRKITVGSKLLHALQTLVTRKSPQEPLLSVPVQKVEGDTDVTLSRRLGPNYLTAVVEYMGLTLQGLQIYHANLRFFQEVTKYVSEYGADWENAVHMATMAVLIEWGHDLSQETDFQSVIDVAKAVLLDPILLQFLEQQAAEAEMPEGMPSTLPPVMIHIPYVSLEFAGKTSEETEFSQWLHQAAVHELYSG